MKFKQLVFASLLCWIFCVSLGSAETPNGSIIIVGSTSAQPLVEELSRVYMKKNPNVKIFVEGGGSGAGIKAVMTNTADIGNVSEVLKPDDASLVKQVTIAKDGIAIIVNKANSVKDLTTEQLQKIYTGVCTNWNQVGGPNMVITVINREFGSGTRQTFEDILLHNLKNTSKCLVFSSTGAVQEAVRVSKETIGYISLGSLDTKAVKAVLLDGNVCNKNNVLNNKYKLHRPFIMVTKTEPAGLSKVFINWVLSPEGQEIVANGYIPIN